MAQLNSQVGRQLVSRTPPKFAGYTVVDNSWKPENLTENVATRNEKGKIFHHGFWSHSSLRINCELTQDVTVPPTEDLAPSQVIETEVTDDYPDVLQFVVMEADPTDFGSGRLKFNCTLEFHEDQDYSQLTPVE